MNVFYYMYCSKSRKSFSQVELLELLTRSRPNNSKLGLTGMLLYKNGEFVQVLEGSEQEVRALIQKIKQDPRHADVVKLLEGYCDERQFPYWYMGFSDVDSSEVRNRPGFTQYLSAPLSIGLAADSTDCQKLLQLFKDFAFNDAATGRELN
jgi:hypothetical protein